MDRVEWARGVIVRERGEQSRDFRKFCGETIPPVAIAVVHDGAGAKDLLDAGGIFTSNTDDHVDEFGEAEGLSDDGAHADVAGLFVGVAKRDLVRKRHGFWPIQDRPLYDRATRPEERWHKSQRYKSKLQEGGVKSHLQVVAT